MIDDPRFSRLEARKCEIVNAASKHIAMPAQRDNEWDAGPEWDEYFQRVTAAESAAKSSDEFRTLELEVAALEATITRHHRIASLHRAGVPAKDAGAIYDDTLRATTAFDAAREWAQSDLWLLALAGPAGTGKTTAAGWLVHQAGGGRMLRAQALARISVYDDEAMQRLESCSLLVIDDLGAEFVDGKGMLLALLDHVVDSRYANRLRSTITTNLSPADFKSRYGERIADRFREAGQFVWCAGPSIRRGTTTRLGTP